MFSLLLLTTPSWTSLQTIFLFFLTLQSSQPSASTSTSYLGEMLSNLPISLCDDLTIKISLLAYLLPSNLHKNMCAWHFQNAYKSFCLIWLKLPAYFVISYLYSFSLLPVTVNHHFLLHFHKSFCPFISFLLTHSMLPVKFLPVPWSCFIWISALPFLTFSMSPPFILYRYFTTSKPRFSAYWIHFTTYFFRSTHNSQNQTQTLSWSQLTISVKSQRAKAHLSFQKIVIEVL